MTKRAKLDMTDTRVTIAYAAGTLAAEIEGRTCPALCPIANELLRHIGNNAMPILEAWTLGYHKKLNEISDAELRKLGII
jgi:hypothetical protein